MDIISLIIMDMLWTIIHNIMDIHYGTITHYRYKIHYHYGCQVMDSFFHVSPMMDFISIMTMDFISIMLWKKI